MSNETLWAQIRAREQASAEAYALFEVVLQQLPAAVQDFPHVLLTQRKRLPTTSGMYMAFTLEPTVWYVGSTQNLRARWATHDRYQALQQRGATHIAYWCHENRRVCDFLEQHFIDHYRPALQEVEYPCSLTATTYRRTKKAKRYDVALSSTEYGHARWFAEHLTATGSGDVYTPEEALTHAAMLYIKQQQAQRRNQ